MSTLLSDPKLVKMMLAILLGIILVETIALIFLAIKKNQIIYEEKEVPVSRPVSHKVTPLDVRKQEDSAPTVLTPLSMEPDPEEDGKELDLMNFHSPEAQEETPVQQEVTEGAPSQIITGLVLAVTVNGFTQEARIHNFPCLLGREGDKCDVVISEPAVSRRHARFIKENEDVYIEDVSEHNGTYLNEVKLPPLGKAKIHEGDEIALGRARIKVKSYLYS